MSGARRIPPAALALGLGGLIPFVAGPAALWVGPAAWREPAMTSFLIYGAVILSFLGGARWGLELAREPDAPAPSRLALSVAPSIGGWLAAFAAVAFDQHATAAALFIFFFILHYVWDSESARQGLAPPWYQRLRLVLTIGVCASCVAMAGAWAQIAA